MQVGRCAVSGAVEGFRFSSFSSKFACQSVCTAWCQALSCQSAPGVRGDRLSIVHKRYSQLGAEEAIVVLPEESRVFHLAHWVVKRRASWRHFNFRIRGMELRADDANVVAPVMLL